MSVQRTNPAMVNAIVRDLDPPLPRSVTGYGVDMPTAYRIRYGTRWHRVYAMQFANNASVYIRKGGVDLFLDTATEYALTNGLNDDKLGV